MCERVVRGVEMAFTDCSTTTNQPNTFVLTINACGQNFFFDVGSRLWLAASDRMRMKKRSCGPSKPKIRVRSSKLQKFHCNWRPKRSALDLRAEAVCGAWGWCELLMKEKLSPWSNRSFETNFN
jgi:hypothetical protein